MPSGLHPHQVTMPPDPSNLATSRQVLTSSLATWRMVARLDGNTDQYVCGCAWSPDGMRLASGSSDTTVRVWLAPAVTPPKLVAAANARAELANTLTEAAHTRARRLTGDAEEALQECSLEELLQLLANVEQAGPACGRR